MASEHEMKLNLHPDRSPLCTRGSSCNLDDFNSLPEENLINSYNEGSEALLHPYHGSEPDLCQDLQSSYHQPLNSGVNLTRTHLPQPVGMDIIPGSFHPLYHQSSGNVSSIVPEQPWSEIPFSSNEGAVPCIPHGAEFCGNQNIPPFQKDFYVNQHGEIEDSGKPTTQSSDSFSIPNRRVLSNKYNSSENIHMIQELHTLSEKAVSECSQNQDSLTPIRQFYESSMNRFQGFESLTQQQSGNEPVSSQSSNFLSPQPHQNASDISEIPHSASCNFFGNELSLNQIINIQSYAPHCGESSKIQNLPLQSFKHPVCRSEDIQSLHQKGLQQSENRFNRQSVILPMKETQNLSNSSQDLHLLNLQPVANETCEARGVHPLQQAFAQNPNKRQSLHSQPQQQFKRRLYGVSHAENQPSTSNTPRMGNFINKNTFLDKVPHSDIGTKYADLSLLQHPYSNRFERVKVLVYGPSEWTNPLLVTYAGGGELRFDSTNSFVLERNVTRCGILMTVAVWKIDDLIGCVPFLKSACLETKSTIVFLLDLLYRPSMLLTLDTLINLMRRDISESVPIILVGSKLSVGKYLDDSEISHILADACFRVKAKYGLSAYLECSVDSAEEVEAVMFTAIDVSFLQRRR